MLYTILEYRINKSITFVIILISTKIKVEGMGLGNLKQLVYRHEAGKWYSWEFSTHVYALEAPLVNHYDLLFPKHDNKKNWLPAPSVQRLL